MDKKQLIKALDNVSLLKGVVCINNFYDELGYRGRFINDYLATGVLAELIDKGVIELKLNEPTNSEDEKRLDYLKRLLEERKNDCRRSNTKTKRICSK